MGLLNLNQVNRALDDQGQPVSGAFRYVYRAGSDVLAPIFEDPNLTIMMSNPMQADENGRFGFCYVMDGDYCVHVLSPKEELLAVVDDIPVTSLDVAQATTAFNTINELVSDTTLAVGGGQGLLRVQIGQMIPVLDQTTAFRVLAADDPDYHFETEGGLRLQASCSEAEVIVDHTLELVLPGETKCDGLIIKQADNANLDTVVHLATTNSVTYRRANVDLHVDGNRNNNDPVIGIDLSFLKKHSNFAKLAASNCDTGIRIRHQVEYAQIFANADNCGVGLHVFTESAVTPDELLLSVCSHDCDTFFLASGSNKMTGTVTFGCEQANDWGAIFEQGWWEIYGLLRGVGKLSGGGVRLDGAALRGKIKIAGGSNTNCAWGFEAVSGLCESVMVSLVGDYADGVFIHGDMEGSIQLIMQAGPENAVGLKMGDTSEPYLSGFNIDPGSRILGPATGLALDLDKCRDCVIDPAFLGGAVRIGADSFDNTLYIPRRQAESVLFQNARSEVDNKIIFRGAYTLAEMNALNGGAPFKGMEVEHCVNFDGARCYFDGDVWVPPTGVLASGVVTIPAGATQGTQTHGLPADPGNAALTLFPEDSWAGMTDWWANVTASVVAVNCGSAPAADVPFRWVLRKAD